MLLDEPYLGATEAANFPKPYVKWSCEPARAQDVPAALARAYYLAMQKPCGPTFVSIPVDDWDVETEAVAARQVSFEFAPDPQALQQIATALNHSQRPALIVGASVDRDGAWNEALELAKRTQAAVWASPMSGRCSFPEDHPLFAGFLPPVRRLLSAKLASYDVVVVLGAPIFTYHMQSEGPVIPEGVQLFQIIDDPEAVAWAPTGSSLLATLRLGLTSLLELVDASTRPTPTPPVRPPLPEKLEPIPPAFVMHTIAQVMPAGAVIVEEAPSHRNNLHDYLPIRHSSGFYTGASGGLGYSLPAAVGISLADPTRRVICVLGDGSSMYSIQGLWSAVQHELSITFVILDNQGYAALKSFSRIFNAPQTPGVDLPGIDFISLARGYGCRALCIEHASDLASALTQSFTSPGPTVIDVIVDRTPIVLY
jgi:benzoylformate decarboxylase